MFQHICLQPYCQLEVPRMMKDMHNGDLKIYDLLFSERNTYY